MREQSIDNQSIAKGVGCSTAKETAKKETVIERKRKRLPASGGDSHDRRKKKTAKPPGARRPLTRNAKIVEGEGEGTDLREGRSSSV